MIDFSFFIGQWFGYSQVLGQDGVDRFGLPTWRCHCERCGRDYIAATNPIIHRFPTPCGCRPPRRSTPRRSRGGLSRSRAYRVWADLRRRCRAGGDRGRYQERGIKLHRAPGSTTSTPSCRGSGSLLTGVLALSASTPGRDMNPATCAGRRLPPRRRRGSMPT